MTAPTPAAVRYAIACGNFTEFGKRTQEEIEAYEAYHDDSEGILRDHIRAIAEEMRAEADEYTKLAQGSVYELAEFRLRTAKTLGRFADKLEGKA